MSETNSAVATSAKLRGYPLQGKIVAMEVRPCNTKNGSFTYLRVEYFSKAKQVTKTTAATAFGVDAMATLATKSVGDSVDLFGAFNGPGFTVMSVDTADRAVRNRKAA